MTHPPENPTIPEPVQAEPVAWMYAHPDDPFPPSVRLFRHEACDFYAMAKRGWTETPLYTRPTHDLAERIEGLVEPVARALAKADRIEICSDAIYAMSSYGPKAQAAIASILAALKEVNGHDRT